MLRFLLLGLALLLSACTSRAPLPEKNPDLPLPLQLHIQLLKPDDRLDWVAVSYTHLTLPTICSV